MNTFDICLPYILKQEGGNDDNPHDPGGRTSRGITQREYNAWRAAAVLPEQDVWTASDEEIKSIYEANYWQPWCPTLPAGVALVYFDMDVNSGPYRATVLLQRALGINDDGRIGPVTRAAIKAANPIKLIIAFSDRRRAFYMSLATYKYFGKGWLSRTQEIENVALRMAAAYAPVA